MTERAIEIVHVGSASRDLSDEDPRGWRLGGGATYSALTTARLGLRTAAVVGVDAAAASAHELDLLRDAGVELVLVALDEGPIFQNREAPSGRVQMSLAAGRSLPVTPLPVAWSEARAWSLVPVADELGEGWAAIVPTGVFVTLGWQGLLRVLVAGRTVERRAPMRSPLVDRANLIGVSRHDLEPGTRPAALLRLLRPGADLLVTDGLAGGNLVRLGSGGRARSRAYAAIAPDRQVDPTGAGDVFLAALTASIVRPERTGRTVGRSAGLDLRFAAAAASLVVEGPGLYGVPDLAAVNRRLGRS